MNIRDRVRELRRVPASDLTPHPKNWRRHPQRQRDGLQAVLDEVGYADALVARELPTGELQIVDGHLRAETTPDALVPVLVVDLDDAETEKVLLTHDALAAFAEADTDQLDQLLKSVYSASEDLAALFGEIAREHHLALDEIADQPEIDIPETYQVVVECRDEAEQQSLYEQIRKEGRRCRVLTL